MQSKRPPKGKFNGDQSPLELWITGGTGTLTGHFFDKPSRCHSSCGLINSQAC